MRSPLYRRALARDLDAAVIDGVLTAAQRDTLMARAGGGGSNAGVILAGFAGVLGGLAVVSFVAANWAAIPDLIRFALILAFVLGALAGAWACLERGWRASGEALALVTALSFGAAVMLIAQIFNIQAHYPRGVLIWAIGAVLVGVALSVRPPIALAAGLAGLWAILEYTNALPIGTLWAFWLVWAGIAYAAATTRSGVAAHVLCVSALVWGAMSLANLTNADLFNAYDTITAICIMGLAGLTAALAGGAGRQRGIFGAEALTGWGALAAAVCGFILQPAVGEASLEDLQGVWAGGTALVFAFLAAGLALTAWRWRSGGLDAPVAAAIAFALFGLAFAPNLPRALGSPIAAEIAVGAAFFAAAAAATALGARQERRALTAVGVAAFFCQALYVYIRAAGELLNTSAFFLAGAVIFGGLAFFILRMRAKATGDKADDDTPDAEDSAHEGHQP